MSSKTSNVVSSRFMDGDIVFRSKDGITFKVKAFNLEFVSTGFPPSAMKSDEDSPTMIVLEEDAKTLDVVFSFAYLDLPLPDMHSLSFEDLRTVAIAADKFGMQHGLEICFGHFYKFVPNHPNEILGIAVKQDCVALMAAVAPYLVSLSVKELNSAGASNRLAVKWSIFREQWISALLVGQKDLERHEYCMPWREQVKPRLRERLFTPTGLAVISVHKSGDRATVQSIRTEVIEWLHDEEAIGITCCVAELENWAHRTLQELALVQFPI